MSYAKLRKGTRGDRWAAMYRDPLGVWRSAGCYPTKVAAEFEATRAQLKVHDGQWLAPETATLTVTDWLDIQLARIKEEVADTTYAGYASVTDRHLRPLLGELRVQALTDETVRSVLLKLTQGDIKRRPLADKTIRNIHALLRRMLAHAVETGLIRSNPAIGARLPKVQRNPKRSITYATFMDVLDHVPDHWKVLVELAAESGGRWGELIAFRPRHLVGDMWEIRQTITETTKNTNGGTTPFKVKKVPKNGSERDVLLEQSMADKLRTLIAQRGAGPDDILFLTEQGNHPSRATFRKNVWLPAVERAEIGRKLRFHDLRGAHASWLLAGGQDIHAVAKRLGWERIETANSYTGALPDAQASSLAALRAAKKRYGRAA
jgi:integrase